MILDELMIQTRSRSWKCEPQVLSNIGVHGVGGHGVNALQEFFRSYRVSTGAENNGVLGLDHSPAIELGQGTPTPKPVGNEEGDTSSWAEAVETQSANDPPAAEVTAQLGAATENEEDGDDSEPDPDDLEGG